MARKALKMEACKAGSAMPGSIHIGHDRARAKRKYPFLLGTTSYIIPDDILPNVRMLSRWVDDIELVLFESPRGSNIPDSGALSELNALARETDTGYTVHLPTQGKAGSPDARERMRFLDDARTVISRCSMLHPRAWILHLEGLRTPVTSGMVSEWEKHTRDTLAQLCTDVADAGRIAVENLGYPWHFHWNATARCGASLCCDVGHLWLHFPNRWEEHVRAMLSQTGVVHLHGVSGARDHVSLDDIDKNNLVHLFSILKTGSYRGVLTLEVFNRRDFRQSLEAVEQAWEQLS